MTATTAAIETATATPQPAIIWKTQDVGSHIDSKKMLELCYRIYGAKRSNFSFHVSKIRPLCVNYNTKKVHRRHVEGDT